jgi:hypothetical protein
MITLGLTGATSISVNDPDGNQSGTSVQISLNLVENQAIEVQAPGPTDDWIRCLPHDFPRIQVNQTGSVAAGWTPGWYLVGDTPGSTTTGSGTYSMILNGNGTPVWYQPAPGGAVNVELMPGSTPGTYTHTVAWAPNTGPGLGAAPDGAYNLLDLDTRVSQPVTTPVSPLDPHELFQDPQGSRWIISSPLRFGMNLGPIGHPTDHTVVDCVIQEVDPQGHLAWEWRASDHIGVNETSPVLMTWPTIDGHVAADAYHCNSIDVDPTNPDHVLVSSRNTAAVYLIDKSSGSVIWKLGGTPYTQSGAQILGIRNDPEVEIAGQHDARFEPNGDISLYDDHTGLSGPSRGIEYSINTAQGIASMDWEYPSPDGHSASFTGSFRCYDSSDATFDQLGNSFGGSDCAVTSSDLIGWGIKAGSGFTEVSADATKKVLLGITFPDGEGEYRAVKVPLGALDISLLRDTAGLPFSGKLPSPLPPYPQGNGYWLAAADGGVFSFGDASFYGSTGAKRLRKPVVGIASSVNGDGYWLVASDGGVFAFGAAPFYGSAGGIPLRGPVTGMASTPDGQGYWLVAADGGVFAFGDAQFHGSTGGRSLQRPIVGISSTPDGQGYWLVAADGGVFAFGDAQFHGSMGARSLKRPIVGISSTPDGEGYWLVAQDGGVFAFGDAQFHGSMGGRPLQTPAVGIASTSSGLGYFMTAQDGGVFAFGDAHFHGSMGGRPLHTAAVGMARTE